MSKPVIVVTIYRRYSELRKSLERIKELSGEFEERPDVVVVWSSPEVGHLWFIQELQHEGLFNYILGRPRMPEDGQGATSVPESHNIRLGLDFVKKTYGNDSYAIVQATDIHVKQGTYGLIDSHMRLGYDGFLFRWANACMLYGVWHTNFFAVNLDEQYWPPIAKPEDQDVLERKWGRELEDKQLRGFVPWNNDSNKFFIHDIGNIDNRIDTKPQLGDVSIGLIVTGRISIYRRVKTWLRSLWNLIRVKKRLR